MNEPIRPNSRSTREALFATTAALALASKTLRLLHEEMPHEILVPVVADLESAWNTLRWWQAERDLAQLLTSDRWSHPVQALVQPAADFEDLLHLCEQHLARQGETSTDAALSTTREKLARAVELNRTAAARRAAKKQKEDT